MPKFIYPRAQLEIETCLRRARDIADPNTSHALRMELWHGRKSLSLREQDLIETYTQMYVTAREINNQPPKYPSKESFRDSIYVDIIETQIAYNEKRMEDLINQIKAIEKQSNQ